MYFQVHQPVQLRKYRFFDIGDSNYYYDDYQNYVITDKNGKSSVLNTKNTVDW